MLWGNKVRSIEYQVDTSWQTVPPDNLQRQAVPAKPKPCSSTKSRLDYSLLCLRRLAPQSQIEAQRVPHPPPTMTVAVPNRGSNGPRQTRAGGLGGVADVTRVEWRGEAGRSFRLVNTSPIPVSLSKGTWVTRSPCLAAIAGRPEEKHSGWSKQAAHGGQNDAWVGLSTAMGEFEYIYIFL